MKLDTALTSLPPISTLTEGDPFVARMREFNCSIVRRAYELFQEIESTDVHDFDPWKNAVDEMLDGVSVQVTETHDQFSVDATVPGFTEEEIEIKVDSHRVVITGQQEEPSESQENQPFSSERRSKEFLRECILAAEIEPEEVTAKVKDGALKIRLPKCFASTALLVGAWPRRTRRLRALSAMAGREPHEVVLTSTGEPARSIPRAA